MTYRNQRVQITPPEYQLLKPGLDVVVNGLADVRGEHYPHRYPWHRVDGFVGSPYPHQAYDAAMAARVIGLRSKLWNLSKAKKIRLDPFELAAAAFALRLWKAHKPSGSTEAMAAAVKVLQSKIERYRRRARREAITKAGREAFQEGSVRWLRFTDWMHYNLLHFRVPRRGFGQPAKLWREQRQQLTELFRNVLAERLFECPNDTEMIRIVTLGTTSARRGRLGVTLWTLLKTPEPHSDLLFSFINKRIELKLLPDAPLPLWKQVSDRGDRFREYQEQQVAGTTIATSALDQVASNTEDLMQQTTQIPTVATLQTFAERGVTASDEKLVAALAIWFNKEVTSGFERPVAELAKYLVVHDQFQHYKKPTTATTIKGLIEELRPAVHPQLTEEPTNEYAAWLLGCLLAVRSDRSDLLNGVLYGYGRAVAIKEGRHNAG
jgi:hypothetical protein